LTTRFDVSAEKGPLAADSERRRYDAMVPPASNLPKRSKLRVALDLFVGLPVLVFLWLCSAAHRR
jgi:hypothetical protein